MYDDMVYAFRDDIYGNGNLGMALIDWFLLAFRVKEFCLEHMILASSHDTSIPPESSLRVAVYMIEDCI